MNAQPALYRDVQEIEIRAGTVFPPFKRARYLHAKVGYLGLGILRVAI